MNFAGFIKIIDALGGVDMNVEASFSDRGYSFTQGMMHMNGEEALVICFEKDMRFQMETVQEDVIKWN